MLHDSSERLLLAIVIGLIASLSLIMVVERRHLEQAVTAWLAPR